MYGKKVLYGLLASMLMLGPACADEEVTTITETNYVTPQWFMDVIETALAAQPDGIDHGIRIVFVDGVDEGGNAAPSYAEAIPTSPQTYLTTSDIEYTVSSGSSVYTTTGPVVFTTAGPKAVKQSPSASTEAGKEPKKSKGSKGRSTIFEYETVTDTSNVYTQITRTAQTTTTTVFSATATPSSTYKESSKFRSVATTLRNPVTSQSVVPATGTKRKITVEDSGSSSAGDKTIKAASFSTDPVYPVSSDSSLASDSSGQVTSDAPSTATSGPSTIDLRIGSETSSSILASASSYVGKQVFYSNGSSSEIASSSSATLASSTVSVSEILSSSVVVTLSVTSATSTSKSSSSSSKSSASSSKSSSSSSSSVSSSAPSSGSKLASSADLFAAISSDSPPSVFERDELPLSIPSGVDNDGVPYQTNKFYVNLFLDDQTDMIWSYPYGLYWKKVDYYGIGVQHTDPSKRVLGPKSSNTDGDTYAYNPTNNAELLISATDLTKSNNYMSVVDMKSMSATIQLSAASSVGDDYIEIPVVQGMGFVTAIYHGSLTAELNTLYGISTVTKETSSSLDSKVLKYRVTLTNSYEYLVYAILPKADSDFFLDTTDSFHVQGSKSVDGLIIQMAVAPASAHDGYYDEAAGKYPVSAEVSGSSSGSSADYSFKYTTKGSSSSGNTIVFALPHHVESLTSTSSSALTPITLASTTKGNMTALLANEISLSETLNADVGFLPWAPVMTADLSYTSDQLSLLAEAASSELDVDISSTVSGMNSNYYSGKVIDKYANILLVVHDIIGDTDSAKDILSDLKTAFKVFTKNTQYYPLIYDTKFGGVTSSASQSGDTGADFGSGYYNDHHFHYGYFVHAAAVVGYVDKQLGGSWADDNKDWVNSLIRDVANPSEDDTYFPVSRMFDWFAGHSWAAGLFASGDGRNEESTSEDYHFSYGMKLWGSVIGDSSMEGRGDLMLSVMNRAMNKYFYYSDDNDVAPSEMVPNKVTGILYDNKIAFTTFFGDGDEYPQYVHGIHMLPMDAGAASIRGEEYVKQEWEETIASFVDSLTDGWAGILRLNQALFDPESSYKFFSSDDFSSTYLDNGQSRTWSLAFSGGLYNST